MESTNLTDFDIERARLAGQLKHYHDLEFTKGVYEHSIFGQAGLLLEKNMVEIPIRIGQVLYMNKEPWLEKVDIAPFQVTSISITQNKKGMWTKKFRCNWLYDGRVTTLSHDPAFSDLGVTVFFSEAEAERVLLKNA